jgi:uncharacterized protein DUF6745
VAVDAADILDHLVRIDFRRPRVDRPTVEQALRTHLAACNNTSRPIHWFDSLSKAYRYVSRLSRNERRSRRLSRQLNAMKRAATRAFSRAGLRTRPMSQTSALAGRQITAIREKEAAARAVRDVLMRRFFKPSPGVTVHAMGRRWELNESAADQAFNPVDGAIRCLSVTSAYQRSSALMVRDAREPMEKLVRVWRPIVDAALNGLFLYWITDREIICVTRPSIFAASGRVHRRNGPAVVWASGERAWFWHGVEVPQWFVERPERITAIQIRNYPNLEVRRYMVELVGMERLINELGGELLAQDECGKLWGCRLDGLYMAVEVENGTAEANGSRRRYFLAVPPWMRTPREAVAWTYGLAPHEYDVVVRS